MSRTVVIFLLSAFAFGCGEGKLRGPNHRELDAGSRDANVQDTGAKDSGTRDATLPDANMPDATSPDASIPDSGTPDSGTPDSGMPDAGADGPTVQQRARLLGLLWGDGHLQAGGAKWVLSADSTAMRTLGVFLCEQFDGSTCNIVGGKVEMLGLPYTYDFVPTVPSDNATGNVNFLAGIIEGEGSAGGLVADQFSAYGDPDRIAHLYDLLTTKPAYANIDFYLKFNGNRIARKDALGKNELAIHIEDDDRIKTHPWKYINTHRVPDGSNSSDAVKLTGPPWVLFGE